MALVLAMVMVLGMSTITAFADGTNTISVQDAKNGETYKIYKMLDLSVGLNENNEPNAYRYTLNSKWNDFWTNGAGKDYIETNTAGNDTYVVWKTDKKDADSMEAFGKAAAAWVTTKSVSADKTDVVATNNVASWENLDNGYYLVTSTYGIATSVASTPTNPTQTIKEKNNANTTDKDVKEAVERNGAEASWGNANDAAIGDTVNFRAKVSIAKNSVNVKYHDTMSNGLDWTGANGTKVYTDENLTQELNISNYSVAAGTSGETFVVTFTDNYVASLTNASTDVYVGYSAILNDNAVVTSNQSNTGKVTWGNAGESSETITTTSTHKFTILKYDGTDTNKQPLAGAKFKLFTSEKEGTALKLAKNESGTIYRVVDTTDQGSTLPDGYTLVVDDTIVTLASSVITIEGVDSDDYWLEETEAPVGYNKLETRIKVMVDTNNTFESEIANNSGSTLPSTGGMGTTLFYVFGAALVIGAGIVLVTRKRMAK